MDTNMYVEFYSDKYTRTPYVENVIECSEEHIHFNKQEGPEQIKILPILCPREKRGGLPISKA